MHGRPGKADRLDARSVAACVRQEAPGLPEVRVEDSTAVLDLLANERETVLSESTRLRNQLHALVGQLDPEYQQHLPRLETRADWASLVACQAPTTDELAQTRAASVRRLAQRLQLAQAQAEELAAQIKQRTTSDGFTPLTEICGIGLLLAGTLAGILGPGLRFRTDAELAAYVGVAPLEASSAGLVRHRLNRGGNRRLNALVHMVAVTQLRCFAPARSYVDRRVREGKSPREALRALKRYLVRAIWQVWKRCVMPIEPASNRIASRPSSGSLT